MSREKMRNLAAIMTAVICVPMILSSEPALAAAGQTTGEPAAVRTASTSEGGQATARVITIDGDPSEWADITSYSSDDANISKWSVLQDASFVYFYVQENGGNVWAQPIRETKYEINYVDGETNEIAFTGTAELKQHYFQDIEGGIHASAPGKEYGKYELEFAIPQSFFAGKEYSLTYCGSTVASSEIVWLDTLGELEEVTPVYNGITVDGTFTDWDAVSKTAIGSEAMVEAAVVFDGDMIYIYMKETSEGAIGSSGPYSNGNFILTTDTGRETTFRVRQSGIEGIDGAQMVYSNLMYEISIPESALKQYRQTISFGYAGEEPLIADIYNLEEGRNNLGGDSDFSTEDATGLKIDGDFRDWDEVPHANINYSTAGGVYADAEGAIYSNTTELYGHVKSEVSSKANPFQPFTIRFNGEDSDSISFRFLRATEDGTILWDDSDLQTDEVVFYYLVDTGVATNVDTIEEAKSKGIILGAAYATGSSSTTTEIEYVLDLQSVAAYMKTNYIGTGLEEGDMKLIEAQYINIGTKWISTAGTSSGPIAGVILCIGAVGCILAWQRRQSKGR